MKILLTISFSLLTSICCGQAPENNAASYHLTIPYRPATIAIVTDTGMAHTSVLNNSGNIQTMTYTGVTPGCYKIQISGPAQPTVTRDSIVVRQGQNLALHFTFTGPCLYDHPADYIPTCPSNHRDSIIPIAYGLVLVAKKATASLQTGKT